MKENIIISFLESKLEKVYLETTFVSYLVSLPSRDIVIAAHQQITSEWWNYHRKNYDCVVSQAVINEVTKGDPKEIQKRMDILSSLHVLKSSHKAEDMAKFLVKRNIIPEKAFTDAVHVAIAAVNNCDYFLTWNCKHLANAHIIKRMQKTCNELKLFLPVICTPEELMEDKND